MMRHGRNLPLSSGRGRQETPKSVVVAVFAADLPETVGGKVLEYWLRAGYYRDLSEPF
jgi:hypothetical protein